MNRRRISSFLVITSMFSLFAVTAIQADEPNLVGRWNLTRELQKERQYPSWLGVDLVDGKLQGRFLDGWASVEPCGEIALRGDVVLFYEKDRQWVGRLMGNTMKGANVDKAGNVQHWVAERAIYNDNVGGVWDIESPKNGSIMMVHKGGEIVGRVKGGGKISDASFKDGTLSFTMHDSRKVTAKLKGDVLEGKTTNPDGKFVAKRQRSWGKPIELFNGKDLNNWRPIGDPKKYHWKAKDGIMVNEGGGGAANIVTKATSYRDFKLHVEFRVPKGGNSGVYLRGRHEVQVADNYGHKPSPGGCGSMYSRIVASKNASKKAGEWQTFDITFIGRYLTVVHNGVTIIDNQEVEGITGGAIDSRETEPGPIYLQGDHGPIAYRKLTLTPAKPSAAGR